MEYSNLLREWNWAVFMPKSIKSSSRSKAAAAKSDSGVLKGWQKIGMFLGQHVTVVQRWGKPGRLSHVRAESLRLFPVN